MNADLTTRSPEVPRLVALPGRVPPAEGDPTETTRPTELGPSIPSVEGRVDELKHVDAASSCVPAANPNAAGTMADPSGYWSVAVDVCYQCEKGKHGQCGDGAPCDCSCRGDQFDRISQRELGLAA